MTTEDLDRTVRREIYDAVMKIGQPPLAREVAALLGVGLGDTQTSFERLAAGHVLVLQEGSAEILMAAPFSAVPTPFAVHAQGRQYFGNCIWDALGIPAMLKRDARVTASCGCCGLSMPLEVRGGELQPTEGVVHFAVPARRWWENIVFT